MQIGEFARVCNTKISVLRHYDKEGLLRPDYTDRFTGYRYYSVDQIPVFFKITALKAGGFSLSQIKEIITEGKSIEEISALFEEKKAEMREREIMLMEAQKLLLGETSSPDVELIDDGKYVKANVFHRIPTEFDEACLSLERVLARNNCQRTSPFIMKAEAAGGYKVSCDAIRLCERFTPLSENCNLSFEDDPEAIGKWQMVGEFAVIEDFYSGKYTRESEELKVPDILYFLPGGEDYWCFSWTRGKLIIRRGGDSSVNDYTISVVDGEHYMFVDLKSYDYRRGGTTTVLVMRRLDRRRYKKEELARCDRTDMPFAPDDRVLGLWRSCGFVYDKDCFDEKERSKSPLFWASVEFKEGGEVVSTYANGAVAGTREAQEWTRGFLLRHWTKSACAYEIREIEGREYLFVEWKSGDYMYGGIDTNYYVFERSI